jgi:hypothetical protein
VNGSSRRYSAVKDAMPWWTEADQAEWELLGFEFVEAAWAHHERCPICALGGAWCRPLAEAFDALLLWCHRRMRRTWATYMRAQQDDLDKWESAAA